MVCIFCCLPECLIPQISRKSGIVPLSGLSKWEREHASCALRACKTALHVGAFEQSYECTSCLIFLGPKEGPWNLC